MNDQLLKNHRYVWCNSVREQNTSSVDTHRNNDGTYSLRSNFAHIESKYIKKKNCYEMETNYNIWNTST